MSTWKEAEASELLNYSLLSKPAWEVRRWYAWTSAWPKAIMLVPLLCTGAVPILQTRIWEAYPGKVLLGQSCLQSTLLDQHTHVKTHTHVYKSETKNLHKDIYLKRQCHRCTYVVHNSGPLPACLCKFLSLHNIKSFLPPHTMFNVPDLSHRPIFYYYC